MNNHRLKKMGNFLVNKWVNGGVLYWSDLFLIISLSLGKNRGKIIKEKIFSFAHMLSICQSFYFRSVYY